MKREREKGGGGGTSLVKTIYSFVEREIYSIY